MKRRLLSVLLAFVLTLTLIPTAWADNEYSGYSVYDLSQQEEDLTINNKSEVVLKGTAPSGVSVTFDNSIRNIILDNVAVDIIKCAFGAYDYSAIAEIWDYDDETKGVHIKLVGRNTVNRYLNLNCRIFIEEYNNSTDAALTVGSEQSAYNDQGIDAGDVVINSGSVNAYGGENKAAIGGSYFCYVHINGGTVNATSRGTGAAIGGSGNGAYVEITGGDVTAANTDSGAAIGSSDKQGNVVWIKGGAVTATSKNGSAIGNKAGADGDGVVVIEAGTITVTSTGGGLTIGNRKTDEWGYTKIYGGTFNIDPSAYVVDGYIAKKSENSWTVVEAKTVTFNSVGGSTVPAQTVANGGTVTEPETPTREGFTFEGWYTGDGDAAKKWDFSTPVTDDMTLTAHWNKNNTGAGDTNIETKTTTATTTEEDKTTTTTTETITETAKDNTKTVTVNETKTVVSGDTTTETTSTSTAVTDSHGTTTTAVQTVTKNGTQSAVTKTVTANKTGVAETKTETAVSGTTAATEVTVTNVTANQNDRATITLDATAMGVVADTATVKKTEVTIPAGSVTALNTAAANNKVTEVKVATDVGTLTIDKTALQTLTEGADVEDGKKLVLTVTDVSESSQDVGSPASDVTKEFTLTAQMVSSSGVATDVFKDTNAGSNGNITVAVKYEKDAANNNVAVYYKAENGAMTKMSSSYTDGVLSWTTNHFSTFQVVETVQNTHRYYTAATATAAADNKVNSASTFDAGVGIYAVSALLSLTGMAWVGKNGKKNF